MELPIIEDGDQSNVDKDASKNVTFEFEEEGNNGSNDDNVEGGDISAQIGSALRSFAPYFTRQIQSTMQDSVNNEIARRIHEEVTNVVKEVAVNLFKTEVTTIVQEELNKRMPQTQVNQTNPLNQSGGGSGSSSKEEYNYKNFSICRPPEYDGNSDPMVSTRWISEIEGSFRITKCPQELKTMYGASMLRGSAKEWWDDLIQVKGEDVMMSMEWATFKTEFFKFFRSEAEVSKLRAEFMTMEQGTMDLNDFKTQFLKKAQFCPEYLSNDQLLKEHFYRLMHSDLRSKISLHQMKTFTELYTVARGFEVEAARNGDGSGKRKV